MDKVLGKDEINKLKSVFEELETSPIAYDFINPVDYVALGLIDYPQIIKNPMDIITVKKKLMNSKYTVLQEVIDDIQLIWDNCRTYNQEGSEIYKLANKCEKMANKLLHKNFKLGLVAKKDKKKITMGAGEPNNNISISEGKKEKKKSMKINKNITSNEDISDQKNNETIINSLHLEEQPSSTKNFKANLLKEKNNPEKDTTKISKISNLSNQEIRRNIRRIGDKNSSIPITNNTVNTSNTPLNKENQKYDENSHSIDEELKEIENDEDEEESNPAKLSLKEKISLSERVKLLANDGLASLVRLVQKECPSSIDDLDEDNLQIKLNKLEKKTYEQLNQLINTFLKVKETNQENLGAKRARNEK